MKAKYIVYSLFVVLLIASCNSDSKKQQAQDKTPPADQQVTVKADSNVIDFPCAVIVEPDDNAIARLKKTTTDDAYRTVVDDNVYYMDESIKFLDSVKVKQVKKLSAGSITFKTPGGQSIEMRLDTLSWAIILFNSKGKPIQADLTSIKDSYKIYMK